MVDYTSEHFSPSVTSLVTSMLPTWSRPRFSSSDLSDPPPSNHTPPGVGGARSSAPRRSETPGLDMSRLFREPLGPRSSTPAAASLAFLSEASVQLASTLDYRQTLENAVRVSLPYLADRCCIHLLDEHQRLHKVAVACLDDRVAFRTKELAPWYSLEENFSWGPCHVVKTGEAEITQVDDRLLSTWARDDAHLQLLREVVPSSCLFVPLIVRGRILGVLTLGLSESGRRYGHDDLPLAEDLGRRISTALDNARRYHELELADRNKNDFLAMLAHELRNPLCPIRNAIELLRRLSIQDPLQARALETIERQTRLQASMLEDLLNQSRIARGQIKLEPRPLDLVALVRQTGEDNRASMAAAGLRLDLELPTAPVMVQGDPNRLTQVLDNLLHNATKFTDVGGRVTLALTVDRETHTATIGVRDTGIGIEPAMLSRIFEPFTQVDSGIARSRGGLGLGLALVKGVMALHGGQVRASSEGLGRGCEITVTLPADVAGPEAEETPLRCSNTPALRPRRILIIEDNFDAAESLQMLLDLYGHKVRVEHSALAGLAAARTFEPELILCDIGLPGMSGYEVAARLKEAPETSSIHLVALTGYGQEEDRQMTSEAGFKLHLTKPVDPEELLEYMAWI